MRNKWKSTKIKVFQIYCIPVTWFSLILGQKNINLFDSFLFKKSYVDYQFMNIEEWLLDFLVNNLFKVSEADWCFYNSQSPIFPLLK